jgi:hypothetical protein
LTFFLIHENKVRTWPPKVKPLGLVAGSAIAQQRAIFEVWQSVSVSLSGIRSRTG